MTEIIDGQAVDVTSSAVTVAQPQGVQTYDAPTRDPLRALGRMTAEEYKAEVEAIVNGRNRMLDLTRELLRDSIDYDLIPGTQRKSLLQPGAEQLGMFHRLIPEHVQRTVITPVPGHPDRIDVFTTTRLHHGSLDGPIVGTAEAACSSYEDRYRWRDSQRTCPKCSRPTIIKGKKEWGGGWLCHAKRGGCGEKFPDGYAPIETQTTGKVENEEPYAQLNTIVQISAKRGFVGAVRHALGITDLFTQDVEDMPGFEEPRAAQTAAAPAEAPVRSTTAARPAARQDAPPQPAPAGVVTFEGPVVATPDGTRSTASGKVLGFAIKVGNSKHNIDLWDDLAVAALPHIKEGVRIRVDGHVVEEDWPGRGTRPMKKVIKDVTRVWLADGDLIAEAKPKAPQPVQQPLMADDGPPLFDDDVLGSAPPPSPAPEPVVQTRDPAEPADATVDLEGTIRSVSWQQTPNGATVAYIELVVGTGLFKVAMKADDAQATIADPTGEFIVQPGGRLRVIGGWNPKGTMLLVGIAVPL